jgi:hypothetical protein
MRVRNRVSIVAIALLCFSTASSAASITVSDTVSLSVTQPENRYVGAGGFTTGWLDHRLDLACFDPSLGDLRRVTLTLSTDLEGDSDVYHFTSAHATTYWYNRVRASAGGLDVAADYTHNHVFAPFTGTVVTWDHAVLSSASIENEIPSTFTGTGTVPVDLSAWTDMYSWWNPVEHRSTTWSGDITACLTYDYVPTENPIPEIPAEPQFEPVESTKGTWNSSYDIGFADGVIDIDLRIRLTGADPGQDLLDQWEEGIERIWSDAYEIQDGENSYRVRVNVDWVTSDWHYLVRVSDTPFDPANPNANRPTMLRWYTDRPGGWSNKYQGQIAAHEAGHMMGLPDEYEGGATLPSFTGTIEDSIMSDLGRVHLHHYEGILDWLEGKVQRDLTLAASPLPRYPTEPPIEDFEDPTPAIPEPGAAGLFAVGLGLLGAAIRRRRASFSRAA